MPSRTALGTIALQRFGVAHVLRVGVQRIEGWLLGWIADQGIDPAHPTVEPRAAAEAADHRDRDRLGHCGAGDRPRMAEVEHRPTRPPEALRLGHQLLR